MTDWNLIDGSDLKEGEVVALLGPGKELALGKKDPNSPTGFITLPLAMWIPVYYVRFPTPPDMGIAPGEVGMIGLTPTVSGDITVIHDPA